MLTKLDLIALSVKNFIVIANQIKTAKEMAKSCGNIGATTM